jgi:FAD/FMN-containing dehydrogenase
MPALIFPPPAPAPNLVPPEAVLQFREALPASTLLAGEPLARHTSFRIGGPADLLVLPHTEEDLRRAVVLTRGLGLPLMVLGNGSNLLVRDGGIRGVVLKVAENLAGVRFRGTTCWAQGGALLAAVSRAAAPRGLGGLEFACGIPGTIGGGVMMNAGACGTWSLRFRWWMRRAPSSGWYRRNSSLSTAPAACSASRGSSPGWR